MGSPVGLVRRWMHTMVYTPNQVPLTPAPSGGSTWVDLEALDADLPPIVRSGSLRNHIREDPLASPLQSLSSKESLSSFDSRHHMEV
jgi:hypothetical protein